MFSYFHSILYFARLKYCQYILPFNYPFQNSAPSIQSGCYGMPRSNLANIAGLFLVTL